MGAVKNASFAPEESITPTPTPPPAKVPTPPPPAPTVAKAALVVAAASPPPSGKKSPAPIPPMKQVKNCPMDDPRFRTLGDKQIRLDSVIKAGTIYSIRKAHIKDQTSGGAYFAAAKIYSIDKTNLSKQQEELEKIML